MAEATGVIKIRLVKVLGPDGKVIHKETLETMTMEVLPANNSVSGFRKDTNKQVIICGGQNTIVIEDVN